MTCRVSYLCCISLAVMLVSGCGPSKKTGPKEETVAKPAKVQPAKAPGLTIQVSYSVLADVLHLVEGVSLWQPGMAKIYFRSFEDIFGLDGVDRRALKKFAFARSELEERYNKSRPRPVFNSPFGPEGMFPSAFVSLVEQFWERVLAAGQPAAVTRSLSGVMEPADAESVARALKRLAPRAGELIGQHGKYSKETKELNRLLHLEQVSHLLSAMSRFAWAEGSSLHFKVHPVWAPAEADFEAVAYGDRILVSLPDGKPIGPNQAALVVHEIGRRLLVRLPAEKKALFSMRFIETAGFTRPPFALVEGVLDALSHGLAGPLMAAGPEDVPLWPGDGSRKKFAEALTPLVRKYLAEGKRMDGVFAIKAAHVHFEANPPRPADFINGAMVIAEDRALKPFKSQVVRWTVWKFPPSKRYNYVRKFEQNPGRSVLLLLTPTQLKNIPSRFKGVDDLLEGLEQAVDYLKRGKPVLITVPRESRGYFFILAARNPSGMKRLAKAFFALKNIPTVPVVAE